ncbi:DUF2690 domain-containing protein [Streptomyces sp. NPDC088736]|uniref:helix-turn-helix domain-containing protein n=1 Tax=Streptomyces sp. NPDC088736 TaxID=3365881 RepID=UPI003824F193
MTDSTRPACDRLAQALQELKARTGLSMTALAERSAYSKSSWQRYLNGNQLAPRKAVVALCATAGEPPGRLLALWELADQEWSGRAREAAPMVKPGERNRRPDTQSVDAGHAAADEKKKKRNPGWRRWTFAAAAMLGLAAAATWATAVHDTDSKAPIRQSAHSVPPSHSCEGQTCAGRDPLTTGCAASGEVKDIGSEDPYRTSVGALLGFRYSGQCHAVWAMLWRADVGDVIEISGQGGSSQRVQVDDMDEGSVTSPMVNGSKLKRFEACYEPSDGRPECFRVGPIP